MNETLKDLDAEDIADGLLYRTGRALLDGRFEGVEDCFILPQSMETLEGVRIVRTAADIHSAFQGVRDYFEANNVRNIARTIVESQRVASDAIDSVHVSRLLLANGDGFGQAYPVYSQIKRCQDGEWRIAHSNYAIAGSRKLNEALLTWRSGDRAP